MAPRRVLVQSALGLQQMRRHVQCRLLAGHSYLPRPECAAGCGRGAGTARERPRWWPCGRCRGRSRHRRVVVRLCQQRLHTASTHRRISQYVRGRLLDRQPCEPQLSFFFNSKPLRNMASHKASLAFSSARFRQRGGKVVHATQQGRCGVMRSFSFRNILFILISAFFA